MHAKKRTSNTQEIPNYRRLKKKSKFVRTGINLCGDHIDAATPMQAMPLEAFDEAQTHFQ